MSFQNPNSMRVLVTGASGQLGSTVCKFFLRSGIDFIAADKSTSEAVTFPLRVADLMDLETCRQLVKGVEVIMHFANNPNWHSADPAVVYSENTTMNINLFQSACDSHCKRIIFSSSIQVLNGMLPTYDREAQEILLPYLPMDSEMPAISRNTYALSKEASERMLKYYSSLYGVTTIVMRFPWLLDEDMMQQVQEMNGMVRGKCFDGYTYLPIYSAAEACLQAITADVTGYNQYFLASKDNIEQRATEDVISEELGQIRQNRKNGSLDSLVDCQHAERELGWKQPMTLTESLKKYVAFA